MRTGSTLLLSLMLGLVLGAIVHLVIVLRVPVAAQHDAYGRLLIFASGGNARLVPDDVQLPFPDPAVAMAVCAFDLEQGPLRVASTGSSGFQSLSFHGRDGSVFYALTDRASVRGAIDIALMTQRQLDETLAREDEDEPVRELRIVSPVRRGLVVVRALAPFPSLKPHAEAAVQSVVCSPADVPGNKR
jgi:uncharacterized membrane protein